MPTYEYECSQCGRTFEYFQSMKDDPIKDCILEDCKGKGTVKRLIGAGAGLIFKGSGFYITDYKNGKASSGSAKGADSSGAGEVKKDSGKSASKSTESTKSEPKAKTETAQAKD